jgi:hypothetical protein
MAHRQIPGIGSDSVAPGAALALAGEKDGLSVEATDLVHLAYQRIRDPGAAAKWDSESFYMAAAGTIRLILIDRAHGKNAQKRGGGHTHVPLDEADLAAAQYRLPRQSRLLGMTRVASEGGSWRCGW